MFTLAVFCLTTFNLPWFMDLTFQVPVQYCSLEHLPLLPSPVTSTTGHYFHFGSTVSFFLELFLYWSPVAYWAPTRPGEFIFQCSLFLPFHTAHGVPKARILRWFAIPFSSGPCFVRTLHHDHPSWVAVHHGWPYTAWLIDSLSELDKSVVHVDSEAFWKEQVYSESGKNINNLSQESRLC